MEDSELVALLLAALVAIFGLRLWAGHLDRVRVVRHVEATGGKLISLRWEPFGPGWLGAGRSRIYRVRLLDDRGWQRERYCKTSFFSGVYFTGGLEDGRPYGPPHGRGAGPVER